MALKGFECSLASDWPAGRPALPGQASGGPWRAGSQTPMIVGLAAAMKILLEPVTIGLAGMEPELTGICLA